MASAITNTQNSTTHAEQQEVTDIFRINMLFNVCVLELFSSIASLAINLSIILVEIWPKQAKNNFYFNLQHFQ